MNHVILDGTEMQEKEYVHSYLKNKLQLNEYYGNNLDALWDALSTHSQLLQIDLIHYSQLLSSLGGYGKALIKVFEDVAKENLNIKFQLKDCLNNL